VTGLFLRWILWIKKEPVVPVDYIEIVNKLSAYEHSPYPMVNHKLLIKSNHKKNQHLPCTDGLSDSAYAISKPTLSIIYDYIQTYKPPVILEFGSGNSTICNATWVQQLYDNTKSPVIYSVEQDEKYIEQVRSTLAKRKLEHLVRFLFAPLTDYTIDNFDFKCYQLNEQVLRNFLNDTSPSLILIDGPSGQGMNRLGTLLQVRPILTDSAHFFLDDALRPGEVAIARQWATYPDISLDGIYLTDRGLLSGHIRSHIQTATNRP
jgi:predicted O-methyltransferase YrrM